MAVVNITVAFGFLIKAISAASNVEAAMTMQSKTNPFLNN